MLRLAATNSKAHAACHKLCIASNGSWHSAQAASSGKGPRSQLTFAHPLASIVTPPENAYTAYASNDAILAVLRRSVPTCTVTACLSKGRPQRGPDGLLGIQKLWGLGGCGGPIPLVAA